MYTTSPEERKEKNEELGECNQRTYKQTSQEDQDLYKEAGSATRNKRGQEGRKEKNEEMGEQNDCSHQGRSATTQSTFGKAVKTFILNSDV